MSSNQRSNNLLDVLTEIFLFTYKAILSPFFTQVNKTVFGFNSQCIHSPTCSEYFASQVRRYGIIQGGIKGTKRLISCQNFYKK